VDLAGEFAARGHRVDLVLARATGPLRDALPSGVRLVDLATRSPLAGLPALLRHPLRDWRLWLPYLLLQPPLVYGCLPALARHLARERPDALLAVLNESAAAALWAHRAAGRPGRAVVSVGSDLEASLRPPRRARSRLVPGLLRDAFRGADAIVASCAGTAASLCRATGLSRARVAVIPNPVATRALERQACEPVDHPWLAGGGPPVVLGAGRLAPVKDFATLLRAFARLRARRPARLVVLGEGRERRALEALAAALGVAEDVSLPGFVRNPGGYMARAALFALSSRAEGFGNVVAEALACGCPVVSTDCPSGPAEILGGGEFGLLVPVGDAERLAEAMARLLDAPPPRAQLVARGREFSLARGAERYLERLGVEAAGAIGDTRQRA
jgi:glycosyltransferase involved in cell wall biosynthesis